MPKCLNCGKNIGFLDGLFSKVFCSENCKKEYKEKRAAIRAQSKEQKIVEKEAKSKGMIKEIRCTCHQCGHVWHYLESDEISLKTESCTNACVGCSTCCSPFSLIFQNKSRDLDREIAKLKKCPKCNSSDVSKEPIYHEKRD